VVYDGEDGQVSSVAAEEVVKPKKNKKKPKPEEEAVGQLV
jgi:hypothetical protein